MWLNRVALLKYCKFVLLLKFFNVQCFIPEKVSGIVKASESKSMFSNKSEPFVSTRSELDAIYY